LAGVRDEAAWDGLMAAAQDGDAASYARLLSELVPLLRAIIRRRGIAGDRVEDVVQDTLLTVHRVRHTYDPARPFVPWLAAIATRRSIDARRRQQRVDGWEDMASDVLETFLDPATNSEVEEGERRAHLKAAMSSLPTRQREALELTKLRELSTAEAARISGQSVGAIKVNTHRAIRALRALLGQD
jgi:RNA polymerase sigma-70 factor (ECF subfamily)